MRLQGYGFSRQTEVSGNSAEVGKRAQSRGIFVLRNILCGTLALCRLQDFCVIEMRS